MSKLDKLIAELCPNGVQFKELYEVINYEHPNKYIVKSTKYNNIFKIPVLTAGNAFILGYTDETSGIYRACKENPVIIFDDFTTSFHWVDFPFKIKSSAMKILTSKSGVDFKFIYFAMKCIQYRPSSHARQWIATYSKFKIPVPPLEIQREIVHILDKFTSLEAELEAELEARKKQYNHYRDQLLSFELPNGNQLDNINNINRLMVSPYRNKVEYKELNDVINYKRPDKYIVNTTEYHDTFTIPVLTAGSTFILGYTNETQGIYQASKEQPVIIFDDFTTSFHWVDFAFKIKSSAIKILLPKQGINFRFIYFVMKCISYKPTSHARQWISIYSKFKIPIPSLAEQERIVSILDKFDALVNDLTTGLPAEIAARRRQYEHYRNRLLTFQEARQ